MRPRRIPRGLISSIACSRARRELSRLQLSFRYSCRGPGWRAQPWPTYESSGWGHVVRVCLAGSQGAGRLDSGQSVGPNLEYRARPSRWKPLVAQKGQLFIGFGRARTPEPFCDSPASGCRTSPIALSQALETKRASPRHAGRGVSICTRIDRSKRKRTRSAPVADGAQPAPPPAHLRSALE